MMSVKMPNKRSQPSVTAVMLRASARIAPSAPAAEAHVGCIAFLKLTRVVNILGSVLEDRNSQLYLWKVKK